MPSLLENSVTNLPEDTLKRVVVQLVGEMQCTVCQDTMTAPFVMSCGHTFCYSCLKHWLKNNLSCPVCRKATTTPPALNLRLRKMLDVIVETVGNDDTATYNELIDWIEERNEEYNEDSRSGQPLFNDLFAKYSEAVVDSSDGVPRCSVCHWEVHGNTCENCGRILAGRTANGFASEDEEGEGDSLLDETRNSATSEDYHNEDEDDDFVDDRPLTEILGSEEEDASGDEVLDWTENEDGNGNEDEPIEIEDEDEDEDLDGEDRDSRHREHETIDLLDSSSEDYSREIEEAEEEAISLARRRRQIVESSDEDSDDAEDSDGEIVAPRRKRRRWS